MHLRDLVRRDFENLLATDRLRTDQATEELIEQMAAQKRDFAIVLDAEGHVDGVIRSSDLLRILQL